jgi:xylulose-5-phosphate/fructose-6-phosphate phosphoketolase
MMLDNHTSRYHIAAAAVRGGALFNPKVQVVAHLRAAEYMHMAQKDKSYIYSHGSGMLFKTF